MTVATFLISKVAIVAVIAIVAELVRRRTRNCHTAFALWAMVLIVLLVPPMVSVPLPHWISNHLESISTQWFAYYDVSGEPNAHASGSLAWWLQSGAWPRYSLVVAIVVWLACGGFVLCRHVRHARFVERLVRYSASAPLAVREQCTHIAIELRIGRRPSVATADGAFSPFLWHPIWGTPRVVFPVTLLERLSPESVGAILRHELIHLRRGDAWRHRVELFALIIWWWLPIAWVMRRRLRELEELCTDEEVLRSLPQGAKAYGHALLDTDEFLSCSRASHLNCALAFVRPDLLKSRITAIAAFVPVHARKRSPLPTYGLVAVAFALGLLVTGSVTNRPGEAHPKHNIAIEEFNGQEFQAAALPDTASVNVRHTENEIVLSWPGESSLDATHVIRLVKVPAASNWPPHWRINGYPLDMRGNKKLDQRQLEWVFAFLGIDDVVIDDHGTRHNHPDVLGFSAARNEDERCLENVPA
jgi:beta-lactamase regulating signal transducer with metallopeptidase domain